MFDFAVVQAYNSSKSRCHKLVAFRKLRYYKSRGEKSALYYCLICAYRRTCIADMWSAIITIFVSIMFFKVYRA